MIVVRVRLLKYREVVLEPANVLDQPLDTPAFHTSIMILGGQRVTNGTQRSGFLN
jgi:hypothetical protein